MSLARRCDRCKAFFDMDEAMSGSVTGVLPTTDMHVVTYDICPACYKDFLVFMRAKNDVDAAENAALRVKEMKSAIISHCGNTICTQCRLFKTGNDCNSKDPEVIKRLYKILTDVKDGGGDQNERYFE